MFAESMNVSRQAVSKWELNQSYPELEKLVEISNYFNVTLDYLVKNNDNKYEAVDLSDDNDKITSKLNMKIIVSAIAIALSATWFLIWYGFNARLVLAVVFCVFIIGMSIVWFKRN